jgi:hypothetical protein
VNIYEVVCAVNKVNVLLLRLGKDKLQK